MKGFMSAICVILVIAIICGGWFAGIYNGLVDIDAEVDEMYAKIETQLQRRMDLIPNLVETVKGYASHEEAVFTEIANARAKLAGSLERGDVEDISEASNALDSALSRLLVITENYPELKANEQFTALMDELAGTENRIAFARDNYNEKVTVYNKKVRSFPTSIFAGMAGFQPRDYFEADDSAHVAPNISFD